MVDGVLNTRVVAAAPHARTALILAATAILVIALLVAVLNRYSAVNAELDLCGGYGGLPDHRYILQSGDPGAAKAHCLSQQPLVSISIKNRDLISLQKKRLQAIERGILVTTDADYVPAHIAFGDDVFKARVRLKGDWSHHVEQPNRWSLRVVLSGNDHILGRKRFSLQTFEMRGHDKDLLYAQHLAGIGLLTPRYKPVKVLVNGEDWGTMVMEDHFNREMIEARRHKESVIGRFDEAGMWLHRAEYGDYGPYDNVYTSPYKPFNAGAIARSPLLLKYDRYMHSMLAAWQEGRLSLVDIIDVEKFVDFIVASEAWAGWHTFRWHNMRFYLNPYTMKLEPVPFDNGWGLWPIFKPPPKAEVTRSQVLSELFDSPAFWQALETRMPQVLSELGDEKRWQSLQQNAVYLKGLLLAEQDKSRVNLQLLRQNLQFLSDTGSDFFKHRLQPDVPPVLDKQRQFHSMVKVSAYENGVVSLSNKMPFAVRVKDVRLQNEFGSRSLLDRQDESLLLPATPLNGRPETTQLRIDPIASDAVVAVSSENPATGQIVVDAGQGPIHYFQDASALASWSPGVLFGTAALPDFVETHGKQWLIPSGEWRLQSGLVVPPDTSLTLQAGARLRVSAGAYLLVHGALHLQGTERAPVVLQGAEGGRWNGIYLFKSEQTSHWQFARLSDLQPFAFADFELSGALNAYRSDLSLDHVTVQNVAAEDAINVVQSAFEFHQLTINQTSSDAIDADFSNGSIVASSFVDVGGDGIDTSGALIAIRDVELSGVADKAISIGEASEMEIQGARIQDVGVGVAAKDYSRARIQGLGVKNARVAAVMAYSKKSEYGGALLEIEKLRVENVANTIINQIGSTVLVDGQAVAPRKVNVDYYYQQGLMPK